MAKVNVFTPKSDFHVVKGYMINRILHSCSCIVEFIKCVVKEIKCSSSIAFYLFSPACLINSTINEHSCKILYVSNS